MSFLVVLVCRCGSCWCWCISRDVVLGDNGEVDFDVLIPEGGTDKVSVLSEVTSTAVGTGGDDTIITGDGADYVIAGVGDDKVNVGVTAPDFGDDVVIGDNGHVDFDTTTGVPLAELAETIAPEHGGDDLIFVGEGDDVVLGGSGADTIDAGLGNYEDVVLGDNGIADFDVFVPAGQTDKISVLSELTSTATNNTGLGGDDEIIVGDGEDFVIAGVGDDKVNYEIDSATGEFVATDIGDDVVIGDNGHADFDTTTGESVIDFIETIAPEHGGDDLIFVGEGADVVLGGSGMDVVHAGVGDFSDVVLGDNGEVDFDTLTVPGTALVKTIASEPTDFDGVDEIIVGDGEDFVIAGGEGDRVNYTLDADGEPVQIADGDDAADYVIGDYGQALFDTTTGESVIDFIETIAPEHGGDDLIFVDRGCRCRSWWLWYGCGSCWCW